MVIFYNSNDDNDSVLAGLITIPLDLDDFPDAKEHAYLHALDKELVRLLMAKNQHELHKMLNRAHLKYAVYN